MLKLLAPVMDGLSVKYYKMYNVTLNAQKFSLILFNTNDQAAFLTDSID